MTRGGDFGQAETGNDIYFLELTMNRIGVMDKKTFAVTEYDVPTQNSDPTELAVGPDGNVLFTDENGNKIGLLVLH